MTHIQYSEKKMNLNIIADSTIDYQRMAQAIAALEKGLNEDLEIFKSWLQ